MQGFFNWRVKYFDFFRTDYSQHLKLQHPIKLVEYQKLITKEEQDFFFQKIAVPSTNTTISHFKLEGQLFFAVNSPIVETITGDVLDGIKHARATLLFKATNLKHVKHSNTYTETLKMPKRFSLLI